MLIQNAELCLWADQLLFRILETIADCKENKRIHLIFGSMEDTILSDLKHFKGCAFRLYTTNFILNEDVRAINPLTSYHALLVEDTIVTLSENL